MFNWIELSGAGQALAYLIEVTGKSVILLAAAGLIVFAFRRASAADKHRIWLAGLVGVLLFPVLAYILPSWQVIRTPEWLTMLRSADFELASPLTRTEIPAIPYRSQISSAAASPVEGTARTEVPPVVDTRRSATPDAASSAAGETAIGSGTRSAVPPIDTGDSMAGRARNPILVALADLFHGIRNLHWTAALFWIWLAGAVLVLGQLLVGAFGVLMLARRARPLRGEEWDDLAEEIGDRIFLKQNVVLLKSMDTSMPMTWGGLNPVVLLPADADSWSDERKRCVLTHEFAHIKRWDCATQGVAQLACAIYWFNPLVWMAARRLRVEREKACDDYVISGGMQASNYAGHLLDIARSLKSSLLPPLGAVSMARPSQLEGRVLAILDPKPRRHRFSLAARIVVSVLAFCVVVPLAAMAPSSEGDDEEMVRVLTELRAAPDRFTPAPASENSGRAKDPTATARTLGLEGSLNQVAADTTDEERRRLRLIGAFTRALADSDAEIRANAVHVLGDLEAEEAIDAIGRMLLEDDDHEVRERAAWALGEIEREEALPALVEALDDENAGVRRQAVWALGEIESEQAVEALIRQLEREEDEEAREVLVWSLGNIEDERAVDVLGRVFQTAGDAELRNKIVWALGEIESPRGLGTLRTAASDSDEEVRRSALWALTQLEDTESIHVFREALSDGSAEIRRRAVWGLAELEDAEAIDALIEATDDGDSEVRRMAVWALGELEDDRALNALALALSDGDSEVRRAAAYALGELESEASVAPLVEALQSSDTEVRRTAAWSLGQIESPEAVPALIVAARDADPEVRRSALWALLEIEDERAVGAMIEALRSGTEEVREMAAHALDEFHSAEIESALIEAVRDDSEEVRAAVVRALSEYESERAAQALIRVLASDDTVEVRSAAAYGLGEIGSDACIDALESALDDSNPEVRRAVMRALGSVDLSSHDRGRGSHIGSNGGYSHGLLAESMAGLGSQIADVTLSAISFSGVEILRSGFIDLEEINVEVRSALNDAAAIQSKIVN